MNHMPTLSLSGKQCILSPSVDDLIQIEQKLGSTLVQLARKLAEGGLGVHEMVVIIEHSIVGDVRHSNIQSQLLESGITSAMQAVTDLFVCILGGYENKEPV